MYSASVKYSYTNKILFAHKVVGGAKRDSFIRCLSRISMSSLDFAFIATRLQGYLPDKPCVYPDNHSTTSD